MNYAYGAFKHSACFDCEYCKERLLPESAMGMLSVNRKGVVKIWCYSANGEIAIMTAMERRDCPYYMGAENGYDAVGTACNERLGERGNKVKK